jgi:hypothetical protein
MVFRMRMVLTHTKLDTYSRLGRYGKPLVYEQRRHPDGEQARAPRARPAGGGFSAQPGSTHAREYCICLAYFCKECV